MHGSHDRSGADHDHDRRLHRRDGGRGARRSVSGRQQRRVRRAGDAARHGRGAARVMAAHAGHRGDDAGGTHAAHPGADARERCARSARCAFGRRAAGVRERHPHRRRLQGIDLHRSARALEGGSRVRFPALGEHPDNPSRELDVLAFWRERRIFARSLEQTRAAERYSFFEGPPTANGKPGVHHVLARSFKDLYPRFWTMRGRFVRRKAGWDTHGLPVEHLGQRALGIFDKSRIEAEIGIAAFTKRCRDSVYEYIGDWNRMTERMGYWVDLDDAYFTLNNAYIESVWWLLKQLWDRGLIYQDYKSVPYDPRIGATLSDHEVAQGYRDVDDPSVFVRFRRADDPSTSFLAWTTTPWTLPSNMALAVHPDVEYVTVEHAGERLIVAEPLVEKVFRGEPVSIVARTRGAQLAGVRYQPLYEYCTSEQDRWYVIPAPFVTTDDGTGIVHVAPAYGPEDL